MISSLVSALPSQAPVLPEGVAVQLPHGQLMGAANAAVKLKFSSWSSIARLKAGQIGALAEDYVEGTLQLEGAMRDVMRAVTRLLPGNPVESDTGWWSNIMRRARSLAAHTPSKDAAQIQFHYDVSDAFYELWLDPKRVYSCAYYRDLADATATLAAAQEAKLDHICRKLMLQPGERFLDIGSGWGALLLWAAEHYGVTATGITLSKNQHAHVQKLIAEKGLGHRVTVQLRDYRDLVIGPDTQPFDKISSVGMFEHVGHANMTAYFAKIMDLLKPGGLVMNHGITAGGLENRQLGAGMGDFIEKYIFPGGELLHVSAVLEHMARAGLEMLDTENLRPHYARTLWDWSNALEQKLDEARAILTADGGAERAEKTLRAYRLYLAGSAMSFEEGWISLHQMLATKPTTGDQPNPGPKGTRTVYPFNRGYMYSQRT
ncbi:MAG: class I SAM-dependent methyltransferase [Polaromonas sp.]